MLLEFHRLGGLRWVLVGFGGLVCLFLLLPMIFIVALSFGSSRWLIFPPPGWTLRWYVEFFSDPGWMQSILTSLQIATVVTILSVLIGLMASFALVRGRFRGRKLLRVFFVSPMVLPVVVLAVGLYALFLRLGMNGTFIGFVLSHLVIALPFSVVVITNSLISFDRSVEDAAVICGATPLQAKLYVTFPAIRLGLFGAAIFSFLISWDDVVLAIFMSSPTLQTLPVQIWTTLRLDLTPVIAAASSLLLLLTLILMAGAALLQKKGGAK